MPRKLTYTVIGSTGEAEGYSAKNLEEHSPTVAGWQTPRFCVYPQELIIQLRESTRLKKLQLLAHQFLIPTKVEFYVGGSDGARSFKRLGYIYLSSNEKTGYKSRELKSVHVDAEGTLLKLVLHKNHLNRFNLYNQVCVMALNIIGDTRSDLNSMHDIGTYLNDTPGKNPNYISPMDDLAFDLYQDPEVAKIIRRLDAQKSECVRAENFDGAKRLKQAIADLRKVGEKLARYELEKRKAVEDEDYDLAKSKKAQMEEYRLKVYQQLRNYGLEEAGIPNYFEMENPPPLAHSYNRDQRNLSYQPTVDDQTYTQEHTVPKAISPIAEASVVTPRPAAEGPVSPAVAQSYYEDLQPQDDSYQSVTSPISPIPKVESSYDDKVIPALSNKPPQPQEEQPPIEESAEEPPPGLERQVPSGEPEPMSEKSIREAASAIDVFGLPLISGAYSKTFSFREDALLAIYKKLKELPPDTSKDQLKGYLRATVFLLKKLIRDKVHSVFNASLQVLELLLTYYIPQHHLGKGDLSYTINQTLPKLILKTGESQARARQTAVDFVVKMTSFSNVRGTHLVPQSVAQPFAKDTATRLAQSRVELVSKLIKAIGLEAPALSADSVMNFCLPALEHTSGAVRDATCQVIYQVYRLDGDKVKNRLPPDEPSTRRNMLYRNIFDEMDRIDGKPTKSELKAQRERDARDAEKKKQAEIVELQAQITQLRNVNSKITQPQEKGHGKKSQQPPTNATPAENPDGDEDSTYLDRLCIFCGEHDEGFDDEGLDLHYWKHCPMLKRCEHCKQVVEISTYNEHLLSECDKKGSFGKCDRCHEAIPSAELQKHTTEKKCEINKPEKQSRCPMCHKNIPIGEDAWKSHLMGSGKDACAENPRRVQSLNRLKAKKQANAQPASKGRKAKN